MTKPVTALRNNALGLTESVAMGVSGTAPSYSATATTSTLIATVGVLSIASLLYGGLIMFGITIAFMHLNRIITNAGAAYSWVGQVFHPALGFLAGWALMVATGLFMVSGTIPAATATLSLIAPQYATNTTVVACVASAWLLFVGGILIKGIKASSYLQLIMTIIEVGILVAIISTALYQHPEQPAHPFSWHWFSISAFTPTLFAGGALISLFYFWGWDVTLNLNEETCDAARIPGYGAIISMVVVLLLFVSFTAAVLLTLSDTEIQQAGTNILYVLAEKIFPQPWSSLAVVAVLLSTVGTLETSILQFTRTLYAKARDGVMQSRYATLHQQWQTPWVATSLIVGIGLVLLFLSSFYTSITLIIMDSVNAIGFQVAFYYGLASLACAWHFRRVAIKSISQFLLLFLWPITSAGFLMFILYYSVLTFNKMTILVGVGGIAIGIIPMLLNYQKTQCR